MNQSTRLIGLTLALILSPLQSQAGTSDPARPVAKERQIQAIESRQGNALVTARIPRRSTMNQKKAGRGARQSAQNGSREEGCIRSALNLSSPWRESLPLFSV